MRFLKILCKLILWDIEKYISLVHDGDKDNIEVQAASAYFQFYHKGLNRRNEDPVNSALNYGCFH